MNNKPTLQHHDKVIIIYYVWMTLLDSNDITDQGATLKARKILRTTEKERSAKIVDFECKEMYLTKKSLIMYVSSYYL